MVARVLRNRDPYQAHYTGSRAIVQSMVRLLNPQTRDVVWEPAAGGGHLIDAVLEYKPGIRVIASELDAIAAAELRRKYAGAVNVTVRNEDALLADTVDLLNPLPRIDKIIANPPYGAWQTPQRRKNLKERFSGLYVKDTYAVFIWHCLDVLKNRGELVCIVPDTFLWLHRHEALRSRLFLENTVHTLILFPSWFFPGVRFGYSGMCIFSVGKETPPREHRITLYHRLKEPSVLDHIAPSHPPGDMPSEACSRTSVPLASLRASAHLALHLPDPTPSKQPPKQAPRTRQTTLGDVADVVTGFYSGNDRHWLRRASDAVRNAQHFHPIDLDRVFPLSQENRPPLEGLAPPRCFVPLLRGGAAPFWKETAFFVDWSEAAVRSYRSKGPNPARFQNSRFYFRQGIGVPMVASRRLTAALLEHRLFDQSIVGIFPGDESLLLYLLGFLNTQLATRLLRTINPTANNSANYLKRLPLILPGARERSRIEEWVRQMLQARRLGHPLPAPLSQNLEQAFETLWGSCGKPAGL